MQRPGRAMLLGQTQRAVAETPALWIISEELFSKSQKENRPES
jgi:hypothetical protein